MKANKLSIFASLTLALILLLGLNSCTAGMEMSPEESSPNATLMLNTNVNLLENAVSGDSPTETTISTLDVLVYEVVSIADKDTTYSASPIGRARFTSGVGIYKIEYPKCNFAIAFVIANADDKWDLVGKSYTVSELKKLPVTYSSGVPAPFKMYANTDIFSGRSDTDLPVKLVRNVARIDVKLTCTASEMTNMPKGGKLQLTQAHIFSMAKTSQLGEPIKDYTYGKGGYINGSTIVFEENKNYETTYNEDGTFEGFTTLGEEGSITFYLPEHFVKEVGTHTYMTIEGKYFPKGREEGVNVIYTLPIGDTITTAKINDPTLFKAADLRIERNVKYQMAAKIKKIEQISDVVVKVTDWELQPVSGSIEDKKIKLNVSSINTSIAKDTQDTTLVQFWSNQFADQVRVLPSGSKEKSGSKENEPIAVNTIFKKLVDAKGQADRPTNLWFNDTAKPDQESKSWGHLALQLQEDAQVAVGDVYTITLAAGGLHRTIKIEITAPAAVQKEESN